ncbi:hypothetical protein L514_3897 [Bordetella bronchiseptica MBORD635]|uniref:hypothetical protein n=1 Tax=Bordetella bronchiseptica TaxID=518 RepID=UPI000460BDEC|nr:hypothetical protein [Bordetella bronchiseptica]KDC75665.1 hypothetical protein L514_3897 [Bordetella bronchiseptica MBORD635]
MSASAQPPASLTHFSPAELDMLAKTADALSAYLGKPVLAEVALGDEGTEWVTFGVALDTDADETDDAAPHVQMGGAGARLLGGRGGLPDSDTESYDCLYLWAVQISLVEGERFIKLDQDGDECAWSDQLTDVLPFALSEDELPPDDDEDDEDDEDGADDDGPGNNGDTHRH